MDASMHDEFSDGWLVNSFTAYQSTSTPTQLDLSFVWTHTEPVLHIPTASQTVYDGASLSQSVQIPIMDQRSPSTEVESSSSSHSPPTAELSLPCATLSGSSHPPTKLFLLLQDESFTDAVWQPDGVHFVLVDYADRPPRRLDDVEKEQWKRRMAWWGAILTSEKNLREYGFKKCPKRGWYHNSDVFHRGQKLEIIARIQRGQVVGKGELVVQTTPTVTPTSAEGPTHSAPLLVMPPPASASSSGSISDIQMRQLQRLSEIDKHVEALQRLIARLQEERGRIVEALTTGGTYVGSDENIPPVWELIDNEEDTTPTNTIPHRRVRRDCLRSQKHKPIGSNRCAATHIVAAVFSTTITSLLLFPTASAA